MQYLDFTEMPVWQKGLEIVEKIYELTGRLPRSEDFALSSQLKRASLSVPANIAEGFGRDHTNDKIRFYIYSRSSAFEIRSHLLAGQRVNFFTETEIRQINQLCLQIVEANNKIIKGLRNSI